MHYNLFIFIISLIIHSCFAGSSLSKSKEVSSDLPETSYHEIPFTDNEESHISQPDDASSSHALHSQIAQSLNEKDIDFLNQLPILFIQLAEKGDVDGINLILSTQNIISWSTNDEANALMSDSNLLYAAISILGAHSHPSAQEKELNWMSKDACDAFAEFLYRNRHHLLSDSIVNEKHDGPEFFGLLLRYYAFYGNEDKFKNLFETDLFQAHHIEELQSQIEDAFIFSFQRGHIQIPHIILQSHHIWSSFEHIRDILHLACAYGNTLILDTYLSHADQVFYHSNLASTSLRLIAYYKQKAVLDYYESHSILQNMISEKDFKIARKLVESKEPNNLELLAFFSVLSPNELTELGVIAAKIQDLSLIKFFCTKLASITPIDGESLVRVSASVGDLNAMNLYFNYKIVGNNDHKTVYAIIADAMEFKQYNILEFLKYENALPLSLEEWKSVPNDAAGFKFFYHFLKDTSDKVEYLEEVLQTSIPFALEIIQDPKLQHGLIQVAWEAQFRAALDISDFGFIHIFLNNPIFHQCISKTEVLYLFVDCVENQRFSLFENLIKDQGFISFFSGLEFAKLEHRITSEELIRIFHSNLEVSQRITRVRGIREFDFLRNVRPASRRRLNQIVPHQ